MTKFLTLILATCLVVSVAGCIVTPGAHCPTAPHCQPDAFCPTVRQFANDDDRFPYLDRNERWRLMSEPEFRDRFSVGGESR